MERLVVTATTERPELRRTLARIESAFGTSLPADLEEALRYYVGTTHATDRAAEHVITLGKRHGIDGGAP